jgi:hypothetical protein
MNKKADNKVKRTRKAIEINNIQELDVTKCITEDKKGVNYKSSEWEKLENAKENFLFRIIGFENVEGKKLKKVIRKSFYREIKKHSRHKFIISNQSMKHIWPDGKVSDKKATNLIVEVVIENNAQLQQFDHQHSFMEDVKVIKLQLPIENIILESLKSVNWLILELPEDVETDELSQAREIVQFCNDNNTPVWMYNEVLRFKVAGRDDIRINAEGKLYDPIYFDLPSTAGSKIVHPNTKMHQFADKLTPKFKSSERRELEVAFALSVLDFQARVNGKAQIWQQELKVNNFAEFCSRKLDISPSRGSQYLAAIRNIKYLSKDKFKEAFGKDATAQKMLPHGYTRYRDLSRFIPSIMNLREKYAEQYSVIVDLIFDKNTSSRKLMELLPKKIEEITGVDPFPKTEHKIDPIKLIVLLSDKIHNRVPEPNVERFKELIEELKRILQTQDDVPVPIDSEVETPEKEAGELTAVLDTDSNVQKEVA